MIGFHLESMRKKCFFVDVDGTIVDAPKGLYKPSEYTKYAFKELSKDNYVFISSGRNKALMQDYVKALNPTGYILLNGAYSEMNGKEIHRTPMNEKSVIKLKEYCLGNNLVYYRETIDKLYVGNINTPLFHRFTDNWNISSDVLEDNGNLECYLFIAVCNDENEVNILLDNFKDNLDVRRQYGFTSFDIGEYSINKGYGVKKVIDYLGIPLEDTYAFGDGLNDLEMIKSVGNGIAMGNAFKEVKDVAKEITDEDINDGFYKYLVNKGFIKPMR